MEFMVVVILSFLLCICNGNVFGPSTQSSVEADKKETGKTCIQFDIKVLKDDMHELLKRVFKNKNEISSLKRENQYMTNKLENKRRHFSCEVNVLHENTNEQQRALNDTNTEINHLNETIEELRNDVDKLEELQRRRSEENIIECIDKSVLNNTSVCELAIWSAWTDCSVSCGNGTQYRQRQQNGTLQECNHKAENDTRTCTNNYCQGEARVSSPCLNGGTCITAGCTHSCICPEGFAGLICEVTPCSSSPCLNGGTCKPAESSYKCFCPTGYSGNQCQVTPCSSSPCLNGGTCKPAGSSYKCSCPTGYSGNQCQVSPCHSSPCWNRGTCSPTRSSFVCSCPIGYFGKQCQATPCYNSPCLHGGTCTPSGGTFVCSCQTGYVGNQCQIKPSCSYGWKMHNNNCYYFSGTSTSWIAAKRACYRYSSILAEATTSSEIRFLKTNAKRDQKTFWLGGSDLVREGLWVWTTSGQRFTVTDWHTRTIREPNNQNGNEHCLNINERLDYEWNDGQCSESNNYICKKPLM